MSNRGLAIRPVWIDQETGTPRAAEEPATAPEVPRRAVGPGEDDPGGHTGGGDAAPVLVQTGDTIFLEGYPVGSWYKTTTRRTGKVLYQQIVVIDGTLAVLDQWRSGRAAAGDYTGLRPAIGIRRTFAGKRMTIGHFHHRRRQVEKRQDCEIESLEFVVNNTFTGSDCADERVITRTHIVQAIYDETEWAKADVDQALSRFVEVGLAKWKGPRLEVTDEGLGWLAAEKARRRQKRVFARPLGLIGESRHDQVMEDEDMTGGTRTTVRHYGGGDHVGSEQNR